MATGTLKVFIPGKGAVSLSPADHVATGGEGMLYIKGGEAYKIFLDPAKARQFGMADKIDLLSQLKHPYIVAPTGVLLDAEHKLIGYRMPAVAGEPRVKTFSNIWRDETQFGDDQALALAYRMRDGVQAAHTAGALLVDGNELNYLVRAASPRLIDVDSWQIGRFRATALMPSIRDYAAGDQFTELTDWYSWGIVSFQVFTGTHPFKGTHPKFKRGDLEGRMRANISVFDSEVRLNSAVSSFDCIPAGLRDWYFRVFQQGRREAPPARFESTVMPAAALTRKVKTFAGGGALKHDKIWASPGVIRLVAPNGVAIYEADTRLAAYDLEREQLLELAASCDAQRILDREAILVRSGGQFVWIELRAGQLQAQAVFGERDPRKAYQQRNPMPTVATRLVLMGNQPYALNPHSELGLQALTVDLLGDNLVVSVGAQWPLRVNSTQLYQGVAVMDCLGTPFIMAPQAGQGEPVRAAVLRDYRVVAAIAQGNALVLVHALSRRDGQLYRLWLRRQGAEMVLAEAAPLDEPELSAAITGKGVIVTISEDGSLTLAAPGASSLREIQDAGVSRAMRLFSLKDGIAYVQGRDVFRLAMS